MPPIKKLHPSDRVYNVAWNVWIMVEVAIISQQMAHGAAYGLGNNDVEVKRIDRNAWQTRTENLASDGSSYEPLAAFKFLEKC
jgi:hypothetical protein